MRGLDTNVLVRYLAADDPKRTALAERALEDCKRNREPLFVPAIVLCELVWVLARTYGQTKTEIVHVLDKILEMDQFLIEHDALVRRSVTSFRTGKGSFSDYLIGEISSHQGCRDMLTFDRSLKNAPGFTLLD